MDDKEMMKRKETAILAELRLLAEMRKLHEWTAFRTKEAEEEEKTEAELDARLTTAAARPVKARR